MIACFREIVIEVFNDKVQRENPPPKIVEEEGVIRCSKCNKRFTRKYSMRLHEKKCIGYINSKQCKICLKIFTTVQGRSNHNRNVKCSPPHESDTPQIV